MKAKLQERLQQMNAAIEQHVQRLEQTRIAHEQANANLNMLRGCQQELVTIINLYEEADSAKQEVPKEDNGAVTDEHPDLKVMGEAV